MQSLAWPPSNCQQVPTAAWITAFSSARTTGRRTRSVKVEVQEFIYMA